MLKTGKHTVTAVTRADSKTALPAGVEIARVNYEDDGQSLTSALKGQQFLVITLPARGPPDLQSKIVKAAADAGVPYVMPNAYGFDFQHEFFNEDPYTVGSRKIFDQLKSLDLSHIVMTCGFWYEWSLALGESWFGFDITNRKVTFFDDGKTPITVSTWRQCGRALAKFLSLPESDASPSVSQWKNKTLFVASFTVSQRDMLDSLNRVLKTTDKDWQITHEPSDKRLQEGIAEMQKGMVTGFAKSMYSRVFMPKGVGNHEAVRGLDNEKIGLPKEDLDEATKKTVQMIDDGWNTRILKEFGL